MFKWNSLYFSVCPLPLVFSMGTTTVPAYGLSTLGIPFPFFLNFLNFLLSHFFSMSKSPERHQNHLVRQPVLLVLYKLADGAVCLII